MLWGGDGAVGLRSSVAIELPNVSDFLDFFQVHIGDDDIVFVPTAHSQELPPRIDEIRLAVELANLPRFLNANPVDCPEEVLIGDSMGGLFEFPQVLAQTSD